MSESCAIYMQTLTLMKDLHIFGENQQGRASIGSCTSCRSCHHHHHYGLILSIWSWLKEFISQIIIMIVLSDQSWAG